MQCKIKPGTNVAMSTKSANTVVDGSRGSTSPVGRVPRDGVLFVSIRLCTTWSPAPLGGRLHVKAWLGVMGSIGGGSYRVFGVLGATRGARLHYSHRDFFRLHKPMFNFVPRTFQGPPPWRGLVMGTTGGASYGTLWCKRKVIQPPTWIGQGFWANFPGISGVLHYG